MSGNLRNCKLILIQYLKKDNKQSKQKMLEKNKNHKSAKESVRKEYEIKRSNICTSSKDREHRGATTNITICETNHITAWKFIGARGSGSEIRNLQSEGTTESGIMWSRPFFTSYRRDSKNERQRANRQSFSVAAADCWTLIDAVDAGPTLVDRSSGKGALPKGGCEIARFGVLKELSNWW